MELAMKEREIVYEKPNMNNLRGRWGKRIYQSIMDAKKPDRSELEQIAAEANRRILEARIKDEEENRNCREPYEDSLVKVCREITRKVKGALWGT